MNYLNEYVCAIERVNYNDYMQIKKNDFINDNSVINIINNYNYNEDDIEKLYKFTLIIIKNKNDTIKYRILGFKKEEIKKYKIDDDIFNSIAKCNSENIYCLANIFLNYIFDNIKYEEFKKMLYVVSEFSESIIENVLPLRRKKFEELVAYPKIFFEKKDECWNLKDKLGVLLYNNKMAEKIEIKGKDTIYQTNDEGEKLFNYIHRDFTKKEKDEYSKIIDSKIMSEFMTVGEHKAYFDKIKNKILKNNNYIKIARCHEGNFKEFFEEYAILIDYAIYNYGKNYKFKFCGYETNKGVKYDGIIEANGKQHNVEVTTTYNDLPRKILSKNLNNYGWSYIDIFDENQYRCDIFKKVENIIIKKNSKTKDYDDTVDLVVSVNMSEFLSDNLNNKEYISSIFEPLKNRKYIFNKVDIFIEKIETNNGSIGPYIISIK